MPLDRRPLVGAFLIGSFITLCLGWIFAGTGVPIPFWGYPLTFALFVVWLYAVGRLLTGSGGRSVRVRSFDILSEIQ